MVNDSLLRLFNSEFFNAWIAVSYLFKYSDNKSVQQYLCESLKRFPSVEIEFFLPQLMHLLVTQPDNSAPLEDTLIELGKQSPHFAVMSIWYLQTYMSDWSSSPESPSHLLCERVLHKCQANLMIDQLQGSELMKSMALQQTMSADDDDDDDEMDMTTTHYKQHQSQAVSKSTLQISVDTHNQEDCRSPPIPDQLQTHGFDSNHDQVDATNNHSSSSSSSKRTDLGRTSSSSSFSSSQLHSRQSSQRSTDSSPLTSPSRPFAFSVSLEDLHGGNAFSLSRYLSNHMKWAQSKSFQRMHRMVSGGRSVDDDTPGLDLNTKIMGSSSVPLNDGNPPSPAPFMNGPATGGDDYLLRRSLTVASTTATNQPQDDPLGHLPPPPTLEPSSSSTSSFFSPRSSSDSMTLSNKGKRLVHHDKHQWVRSGYFQYEMQFLVALSDIAERLVALPKHARVSALHAELTLLNHNLPAEICLPLWCSGSCSSLHHRVVRVSPSDAVVLNSAERAPYLLMIEVLEDSICLELDKVKTDGDETAVSLLPYGGSDLHKMTMDDDDDDDETMDLGSCNTGIVNRSTLENASMTMGEATTRRVELRASTPLSSSPISGSDFSQQMRTAAVLLAQLQRQDANDPTQERVHVIRQRVIDQMVALEEQRLAASTTIPHYETMVSVDKQIGDGPADGKPELAMLQDDPRVMMMNKDDPSAAVFSEAWQIKKERIRESSPFGHLPNWRLLSVIVKQGTDLRQEQFAIQLIREMQKIWQDAGVDAWVKYYRVLVTSNNSGLIETIRNTMSIHSIKKTAYTKQDGSTYTLRDFFEQRWGPPTSSTFHAAQSAFMKSLVGYSIACYLLQIKDRHNGNLLIDDEGHLIHIDFGFVLSNSPGSVGFEMAPFKLSQEYIDVLGGMDSDLFGRYQVLMKKAFKALRKYGDNILLLVEMMSKNSNLPCFQYGSDHVLHQLRERFQFHLTDPQLDSFVDKLIANSCGNLFTRLYDTFQYFSQGIL